MMPRNRFASIARISGKETNKRLGERMAQLTVLTEEELNKLLPTKGDKERFVELMAIVNSASSDNRKLAKFSNNVQRLGGVAIRVLRAVV